MAERKTYRVVRPLWVDRQYEIGEMVEMDESDAKPLLGTSLEDAGAKAARPVANKMAPDLLNKARTPRETK